MMQISAEKCREVQKTADAGCGMRDAGCGIRDADIEMQ